MTRWGRARLALIALGVAAILFLFVFPTSSYLAQRRQVARAQHDVAALREQNAQLAALDQKLRTPQEVERMARQQFSRVFPGEHLYYVASPAASTTTTSTVP